MKMAKERKNSAITNWLYRSVLFLLMMMLLYSSNTQMVLASSTSDETDACISHDWSDWETENSATIRSKGKKVRYCYNCNREETKATSKLTPTIKLKKSITLKVGQKKKLRVSYAKGDKVRRWKSSKSSVVSVNSRGKLTAKKAGRAKVTVTLKSGRKAVCKVTVKAAAKKKSKAKKKNSSSGNGTVFWTPGGEKYHKRRNCVSLKRSSVVHSGPLSSCPKSSPCRNCYR